jgi:mRNA interferase RelE/StbE
VKSSYKIRLPEEVAGLLRGLHPELKRKIKGSLRIILDDPNAGKSLKD